MDLQQKIKSHLNDIIDEIIEIRHQIHQYPEIGFDLDNTIKTVKDFLIKYGLNPIMCGKAGVICKIGDADKTILFRADMDALDIQEETNLEYKSKNNYMHACGHDMHTAILLGVAYILSKLKDKLDVNIILMFQPAEEILSGAIDMLKTKMIENLDAAFMLHVMSATKFKTGVMIIPPKGVIAPAACHFKIIIKGFSSHVGLDGVINPIDIATAIIKGIRQITNNENDSTINITSFKSGSNYNVIPSDATLLGTIRSYDLKELEYNKKRLEELSSRIANSHNGNLVIQFNNYCPNFICNEKLVNYCYNMLYDIFGENVIKIKSLSKKSFASEDFSYFSHLYPTAMFSLSAGAICEGYNYQLHNPKVMFNDNAIAKGINALLILALNFNK